MRGLRNLGNSCYLNSVLQVLAATGGVREHFLAPAPPPPPPPPVPSPPVPSPPASAGVAAAAKVADGAPDGRGGGSLAQAGGGGGGATRQPAPAAGGALAPASRWAAGAPLSTPPELLTDAMRAFFAELHSTGAAADALRPERVLQAVGARHDRYARRAEQDSHEVLRQLLEGLRSEMTSALKRANAANAANAQTASHPTANSSNAANAHAAGNPASGTAEGGAAGAEGAAPAAAPSAAPAAAPTPAPPAEPDPRTIVDDLFSGELRSTIVCLTCGSVSCSHEPFLDLSLPIPRRPARRPTPTGANEGGGSAADGGEGAAAAAAAAAAPAAGATAGGGGVAAGSPGGGAAVSGDLKSTIVAQEVMAKLPKELTTPHEEMQLAACLQAFSAPETLSGENAYVCETCDAAIKKASEARGEKMPPAEQRGQPALKWLQLKAVPRTLTLHLKRFRATGRKVHKLDDFVPFPPALDLAPFISPGEPVKHYTELAGARGGGAVAAPPPTADAVLRLYALVEHQGSFSGGHYIAYVRLHSQWYRMSDSVVREVREAEVLEKQAFMLFYTRDPMH